MDDTTSRDPSAEDHTVPVGHVSDVEHANPMQVHTSDNQTSDEQNHVVHASDIPLQHSSVDDGQQQTSHGNNNANGDVHATTDVVRSEDQLDSDGLGKGTSSSDVVQSDEPTRSDGGSEITRPNNGSEQPDVQTNSDDQGRLLDTQVEDMDIGQTNITRPHMKNESNPEDSANPLGSADTNKPSQPRIAPVSSAVVVSAAEEASRRHTTESVDTTVVAGTSSDTLLSEGSASSADSHMNHGAGRPSGDALHVPGAPSPTEEGAEPIPENDGSGGDSQPGVYVSEISFEQRPQSISEYSSYAPVELTPADRPDPPVLSREKMRRIDQAIELLLATMKPDTRTASLNISGDTIAMVCSTAEQLFLSEPPLLEVAAPLKIVGDIHGQFMDLLRYFEVGGFPPQSRYLFLGDYVDRGNMGIECTLLLLCYKLKYPDLVYMIRGNHECSSISRVYGFYEECKQRYSPKTWKQFNRVFDALPFAAIVNDSIFCTHGGLSPDLVDLNQIRNLARPCEIPDRGLVCDLVWSDPCPEVADWKYSDRGVSYLFGENAVDNFLERNGLDLVVRAHQVVENGYEFFPPDKRLLVTVFSAVNYCGQFDNAGAMMIVDDQVVCSFHVLCPTDYAERIEHKLKIEEIRHQEWRTFVEAQGRYHED